MTLIDIRADNINKWRKTTRALATQINEIQATATANDKTLLALHKLAVLLIGRNDDWQRQTEILLKKRLSLPHCQLWILGDGDTLAAREIRALPSGGTVAAEPLAQGRRWKSAKSYFHLPLKKGGAPLGVLTMAANTENAFDAAAARDFTRRLAEMLAAAI